MCNVPILNWSMHTTEDRGSMEEHILAAELKTAEAFTYMPDCSSSQNCFWHFCIYRTINEGIEGYVAGTRLETLAVMWYKL